MTTALSAPRRHAFRAGMSTGLETGVFREMADAIDDAHVPRMLEGDIEPRLLGVETTWTTCFPFPGGLHGAFPMCS